MFSSNRPAADGSTDFEIYSMRADGTGTRQLTNNTAIPPSTESGGSGASAPTPIDDRSPAVSPDGKEIAFVSNRPAADGKTDTEIYVMNIDGTDVRQITNNSAGGGGSGNDYEPAWSPDGRQIVYRHNDGRMADLYIVDVRTGQETKLVTAYDKGPAAYDAQPSWSPDGTKILFRKGMGKYADIWEYNLLAGDAATATRMLIHDPAVPESSPSWSPDGRQIVFVRGDEGAGAGIWVADANGSGQHEITQPQPTTDGLLYSDLAPRWSPDGRRIVFTSTRDGVLKKPETESGTDQSGSGGMSGGHEEETEAPLVGAYELFVINSDGSDLTRLTQATSSDGPQDVNPDWQTIPLPAQPAAPETPTLQQLSAPVVEVPVVSSRGGGTVCLTRRVERIQVRVTAHDRRHLWAWWVTVNGKRVKTSWNRVGLTAIADLRGVKTRTARVSVTIWLTGVVRLTARRTYQTCTGGRAGVTTFHLVRQTHPRVTIMLQRLGHQRVRLSGLVQPGHKRQRVMIQRKTATGWETVATTRTSRDSQAGERYALALRSPRPGIYRAHIEPDARHLRSSSRVLRLP
ncbi:MAG TPA: hypothetical protein VFN87_00800 [Solirubrobacteraceae bacterium]|nr:hypothetical protein [Solirubrobacteraceae bacterium]